MKRIFYIIPAIVLVILIAVLSFIYYKYIRGALPSFLKASQDITQLISEKKITSSITESTAANQSSLAAESIQSTLVSYSILLKIPNGFSISIFAKNITGVRVMTFDLDGNMWISQTSQGKITRLNINNGIVTSSEIILENLNNPHGLAFDPDNPHILYFAEETKISRFDIDKASAPEKLVDLSAGRNHYTKTTKFGPGGKIYISTGSTCNACLEKDDRYAKIFVMDKDQMIDESALLEMSEYFQTVAQAYIN